ncbi:MAG: lipase [Pseudopedobacter saltans]|uniref:triacylglycerol lipase n=1 Tax=Pseudopedobacter saltans TaxID=151895 RepID=A0A2W5F3G1_9SPHI|nr:MAG: lipase [Pseudopedobacter saltans]
MTHFQPKKVSFLFAVSCIAALFSCNKNENLSTPKESESVVKQNDKEAVKVEPTTSLSAYSSAKSFSSTSIATMSTTNKIPIVLVHGLFGFGRDEVLGLKYWGGGFKDLQEILKSNGYPTFTSNVGPVSSNYDRAIELYYQIKGGTVDYGKAHSDKVGHLQKTGKTYPGLYPEWDANHPIHLMSHSMGGQTVRYLLALLEKGSLEEKALPDHASIFDGNRKGWVKSMTTISAPHNGSTLTNTLGNNLVQLVKDVIITTANIANSTGIDKLLYDFDLDQWGMRQNPGESFNAYLTRVGNSKIWKSNDVSVYDLKPSGAVELNNFATTSSDVYYFSLCTKATNTGILTGWQYPKLSMLAPVQLLVYPYPWPLPPAMGNYTSNNASANGGLILDKKWWANDGIVNTFSMRGPVGSTIVDYKPGMSVNKGIWYTSLYNGYDHFDIVGLTIRDVTPLYLSQADLLSKLP